MHHGIDLHTLSTIVSLSKIREQHLNTAAAIDRSISRLRGDLSPGSRRSWTA